MPKEEKFVQFCPICGSKNFTFYRDDKAVEITDQEMFKCKRCGNIFSFPLELPKKEASKIREVPLTSKIMRDTPASATIPVGNVEIGVYWKVLGIVMFFFGLAYLIMTLLPVNCYITGGATICDPLFFPPSMAFVGLAILAAGMYFILESYTISHKKFKQTRLMKIGLVMALLIIVVFFSAGSITIWTLP